MPVLWPTSSKGKTSGPGVARDGRAERLEAAMSGRVRSAGPGSGSPCSAGTRAAAFLLGFSSNVLRHHKRITISAAQEPVSLVVADHLLGSRIEGERATQDVRGVGQVDQGAGDVTLLDRRAQILLLAAAHAVDEVGEVVLAAMPFGSWRHLLAEQGLVRVIAAHRHAAL